MHMYSKISVLLIEDNREDISSITQLLEGNGYKVTAALTGSAGLSLAASICPDAVLLNLGLPDINGYEVLRQLRSWSKVPIIIISTRSEESVKVLALDSGADDYITKPFGTGGLLADRPAPPARLRSRQDI